MHRTAAIALGLILCASTRAFGQAVAPRTVDVDGVRLEYIDWGGSQRALVLVPGGCDTAFVFGDLAPRLTAAFRVLSLTPRGCAGSGTAADGYGIDAQLKELAGFLDSQGITRAVLAGHSSGGGKITRFARLYPSKVAGLVYFDTVYSFVASGLEERMSAAIDKQLSSLPDGSIERARATAKAWELGVWSQALERNLTLTFNHSSPEGWWSSFRADMNAGHYFETAIKVPALMFFSIGLDRARSRQFDAATQAALKSLVDQTESKRREQIEAFQKNGAHVEIIGQTATAHYSFAQNPAEMAEAIRTFVTRIQ